MKETHLVAYPGPRNSLPQNNLGCIIVLITFMLFIVTKIPFYLKLNTVLSVFSLYIIHVTSQIKNGVVVVFLVQCPFSCVTQYHSE